MIPILAAAVAAFLVAFVLTPAIQRFFSGRKLGQAIREDGPKGHWSKAGTPTMGGLAIVVAVVVGYSAARFTGLRPTPTGLLALSVFVGMAVVGAADDLIKLRANRNLGLSKVGKLAGLAGVAVAFGVLGVTFAAFPTQVTFLGDGVGPSLPVVALVAVVFVMLISSSNAVNLTDGLDGLVAGSAALVFAAYTLIAFWQARNPALYGLETAGQLDVAVLAAAACAAVTGFLWHNAPPATIFMGDTGSLALGGLMAALATATRTQLLLIIIGGLYVLETLSVIAQVASFKTTGRRVLRMAPLHHHLELSGWKEPTVIIRLWVVAAVCITLGLGVFYADFLARGGVG